VVVLTARTETASQMRGLKDGATVYLKKPLESEVVAAQVHALLQLREQPDNPTVSVGDLICDTRAKRICYHGEPLDLSAREYGILHLLLCNPGKAFSRREIMDRVWEDPRSAQDSTVVTHIKNLRRKLKHAHEGGTPICTRERNGFGYYLETDR
jgi:DNA-binding response OmpR family regulator